MFIGFLSMIQSNFFRETGWFKISEKFRDVVYSVLKTPENFQSCLSVSFIAIEWFNWLRKWNKFDERTSQYFHNYFWNTGRFKFVEIVYSSYSINRNSFIICQQTFSGVKQPLKNWGVRCQLQSYV